MYILHVFPLGDYVTQLLVSWTAVQKVWVLDLTESIWCFLGQTLYFPPGLGYRLCPDLFPGNYTLYVQFHSVSYPNLTYIFVVQWGILIVFLNTLNFSCREVRLNPSAVQVIFNIYIYCSKKNFPKFFLLVIHLSSNLREELFLN